MEHCIGTTCTSVEIGKDLYRTEIRADEHLIIADEPLDIGGKDLGMNPNQLLLASLGACTAMTLRMYADRKQWDVEKISVNLTLDVVKGTDQQTTYIKRHISVEGNVSEEQKRRMLEIANSCPLHRMLNNPFVITSNLLPGSAG